jgi:hypothetical protein
LPAVSISLSSEDSLWIGLALVIFLMTEGSLTGSISPSNTLGNFWLSSVSSSFSFISSSTARHPGTIMTDPDALKSKPPLRKSNCVTSFSQGGEKAARKRVTIKS